MNHLIFGHLSFLKYLNLRKLYIASFVFILMLAGCNTEHPKETTDFLNSLNRMEKKKFQMVLGHYKSPEDSLKLKAAYYLFKYMPYKFSTWPVEEKRYFQVFDSVRKPQCKDMDAPLLRSTVDAWIKDLEQKFGSIQEKRITLPDIKAITPEILIENIDYAFKVWDEMPWASHVSFDDFCEFLLPYRIYDEPLSMWRKNHYEKYKWIADSFPNEKDPKVVCEYLNSCLAKEFVFADNLGKIPYPAIRDIDIYRAGICEHRYVWVVSVMRSIGIPVVIDYTPPMGRLGRWTFMDISARHVRQCRFL
jgi:hypothetical protein